MTEGTSEPHISGVLMPNHQILSECSETPGVSHITISNTMIGEVVKSGIYPLTDILPHVSTAQALDSTCAMYAAAIPADVAGNLPEGAVLQIMPDATVVAVASLKDIPKSCEISNSSVMCTDEELKDRLCNNNQETEQNFSSVQNLSVETSEENVAPVIELAGGSEGNVSDLDLNFLNEPEDAGTISDSQGVQTVESETRESLQNLPSNQLPSTDRTDSCNSIASEHDQNLVGEERPDSALSNSQGDGDSNVVVIDVSKPIQLSHNSLIVVNGQKCVLQHNSQTGQVVAYPVKEPERPKRKRGRPRKVPNDGVLQPGGSEAATFSSVETEDISEDDAIEKGLLEVVTDDGAVVRRSSRKRRKAKTLKDYETGNLKQELGSDIDESEATEKDDTLIGRKKGKPRGPGRPRKYPLSSTLIAKSTILNNGRKQRGRPRSYVADKDATQAFFVQTAAGQNLMMHVPVSCIPPGMSLQDVAQGIANSLNLAVSQNSLTNSSAVETPQPTNVVEVQVPHEENLVDSPQLTESDQTSDASLRSGINLSDEVPPVNSENSNGEIMAPCLPESIENESNMSFEQIESLREMSMDSTTDGFVNNTSGEIISTTQPVITESPENRFNIINQSNDIQVEGEINSDVVSEAQRSEEMVEDNNDSAHFIKINVNEDIPSSRNSIITVTNNGLSDSSAVFSITSDSGVTHFRLCGGNVEKVVKEIRNNHTGEINNLSLDESAGTLNSGVIEESFKSSNFVSSTPIHESVDSSAVNQAERTLDSLLTGENSSDAVVSCALVNDSNEVTGDTCCPSIKKYEDIASASFEAPSGGQSKETVDCPILTFDSNMDIAEHQPVEPVSNQMKDEIPEPSAEIGNIMNNITIDGSTNNQANNSSQDVASSDENDDCGAQMSADVPSEKLNGVYTFTVNNSEVLEELKSSPSGNMSAVPVPEKRKRGRPRKYPLKNNGCEKLVDPAFPSVGFELASLQDVTSLLNQHSGTLPEIASSVSSITGTPATVIPLPEKILPMLLPKPDNLDLDSDAANKLNCPQCDYHADNVHLYQQHLLSHPNETKHCKCCKFLCFAEEELIQHFNDKHPRCICSICNHMAEHAYIIKRHLFRHTENGCSCEICGKTYKDHYILKTHVKMVHMPADTLYQCHLCEKKFTRKAHLKRHLRTHDPDKPYKCDHCDYRGCEKSDITKHMLVHEEPKHACKLCGKTFRHIKNKELHLKRHKGQRDFKCGVCEFFGYTVTDIKKHIERRHLSDPKTIMCGKCGQACASQEVLKEHQASNQCENFLLEQILTEKYEENATSQLASEENVNAAVSQDAATLLTPVIADSSQEVHNITAVTLEDGTVAATLNTDLGSLQNGQIILGNVDKILGTTENGEIIFRALGGTDLLSSGYLALLPSTCGKNAQLAVITTDGSSEKLPENTAHIHLQPDTIKDDLQEACASIEIREQQKNSETSVENLIINNSMLDEYRQGTVPHITSSS